MKTTPLLILSATLVLAIPAVAGWGQKITLKDCPEPVRNTIERHKGHVDEVRLKKVDGADVYRVEIERPKNSDLELYLAADGKVQRSISEIAWGEVPEKVRSAAEAKVPEGARIDDITVEESGDTKIYVVEIDRDRGADLHLVFDPEGKLTRQYEETDD